MYLLIDCSESMAGPAIDAVNEGLQKMIGALRTNPYALETVFLSLITFSNSAKQVTPLKELVDFAIPKLSVRPGTSLGTALKLMGECINRDVVKATKDNKGDYRPLVFLLTDGQPTDDWANALSLLTSAKHLKIANIYAIGCGDEVDFTILRKITDVVFKMSEMTAETFGKLFVWLTASVSSASLGTFEKNEREGLSNLPKEIVEITPEMALKEPPKKRQVFIRARCSQSKKVYLMRFKADERLGKYVAVASHPLDDEGEGEGSSAVYGKLDSNELLGCPPCPYCENTLAGVCSCKTVFCLSERHTGQIVCPNCNSKLSLASGGEERISIDQSKG